MEEKIREIILNNAQYPTGIIAKEICVHITEFICWLFFDQSIFFFEPNKYYQFSKYTDQYKEDIELWTLEKVYQYWQDNVKNKNT
jgi:hypothetical protein